jgi:hypothetical protein
MRMLLLLVVPFAWPLERAAAFFECGVLETHTSDYGECLAFQADHLYYWLSDYGGFQAGDSVLVRGTGGDFSWRPCDLSGQEISVELIRDCHGFDFGCGTLYFDGEYCRYFTSPRYGDFLMDAWGGFQEGDTVRAYGGLWGVITFCGSSRLIIPDSVTACTDTLTSVSRTSWGQLKALFRR